MRVVARAVADKPNGGALIVGRFEDITLYRKYLEANGSNSGHYLDVNDPLCPNGYLITSREVECLIWVSLGKTAWETANIMGRSARTVEFHLNNAVKKLGASNKVHAAAKAIRLGLL